jgi:Ca-activated chloride channel family protein
MLEHFHFIRPMWLLALLPLALLAWYAFRPANGGNAWRRVVDARLLPLMMATGARGVSWSAASLVLIGWMLATFALADPTWDLKPQPVFQTNAARVVVLDLSSSMNDADLKPSRLVRARYKIEDVLAQAAEGQTALVAYAGDAFTVAPLTRDANTIRSLLKVLEPDLMPADGSRADLGLSKAGELLHQAGVATGQILLIADGVDPGKSADTARAAARLKSEGYTVSVLGVGTQDPLPLTDEKGRLVRTDTGGVQVPKLDVAALEGDHRWRRGPAVAAPSRRGPRASKRRSDPGHGAGLEGARPLHRRAPLAIGSARVPAQLARERGLAGRAGRPVAGRDGRDLGRRVAAPRPAGVQGVGGWRLCEGRRRVAR